MARERVPGNAVDALTSAMSNVQTVLNIGDLTGFPSPPYRIRIGDEVMRVTDVFGLVLTVERGSDGTTPAAHANAAEIRTVLSGDGLSKTSLGLYGAADAPLHRVMNENADYGVSNFTWLNQGTATAVDESHGGITFTMPSESKHSLRGLLTAAPSTPWTMWTKCQFGVGAHPYDGSEGSHMGLWLRDSNTGRIITSTFQYGRNSAMFTWDSATSVDNTIDASLSANCDPMWLRMRDTGSNHGMDVSHDGHNWLTLWVHPRTDWLANGGDQLGIYCASSDGASGAYYHFLNWVLE